MDKERINLVITKEQLEAIYNSVEERRAVWRRTLEYHKGSEAVGGEIEECSNELEAEYIVGVYDQLFNDLEQKVGELGVNILESLALEELEQFSGSIEILRVFRGDWERIVYAYCCNESDYLFFDSTCEMIRFFDAGKKPGHQFTSEAELHTFLRYWKG